MWKLLLGSCLCLYAGWAQAQPRHLIFAFVDHYEPGQDFDETAVWVSETARLHQRHLDADGRHPIHSFFQVNSPTYFERFNLDQVLVELNQLTYDGYGEIEYHLHHGAIDESLRTEAQAIEEVCFATEMTREIYQSHGALITARETPEFRFGFIHGMWALDNSRIMYAPYDPGRRQYCGVNHELALLRALGCYADFTFPAWGSMEPWEHDCIMYASDDDAPASYQNPLNIQKVQAGTPAWGDLMLIQGPWSNANIAPNAPASLARMDEWVNHNIHVIGREDWVFVKVHTHGCADDLRLSWVKESFFGAIMDNFYTDIEARYNDAVNWKLHYVSAREMYNIVKAAEAGCAGDPGAYRDFVIPPYANQKILTANRYLLQTYSHERVEWVIQDFDALDMCFKEYRPGWVDCDESFDGQNWHFSDAMQVAGAEGELRLIDETPAQFYRISRYYLPADLNHDQAVDISDLLIFTENWLWRPQSGLTAVTTPKPGDLNHDSKIDLEDFARFRLPNGPCGAKLMPFYQTRTVTKFPSPPGSPDG